MFHSFLKVFLTPGCWRHGCTISRCRASCKCKFALCREVEYFCVSILSLQIKRKGKEGRKKRRPGEKERERKRKNMHSFTLSISSNETSMVWSNSALHLPGARVPLISELMPHREWLTCMVLTVSWHGTSLFLSLGRRKWKQMSFFIQRFPKGITSVMRTGEPGRKKACAQRQSGVGPLFDDPWETKRSVGTKRRPLFCREYLFQICFSQATDCRCVFSFFSLNRTAASWLERCPHMRASYHALLGICFKGFLILLLKSYETLSC